MKIIIYALGKIFNNYKEKIDWTRIVALADKEASSDSEMYRIPVISPERISDFEYDFIVVFSDKYFEEIRMELTGEYFVAADKILPWRVMIAEPGMIEYGTARMYELFCEEKNCTSILDMEMSVLPKNYLTKEELFHKRNCVLDGIWSDTALQNVNLYDSVFEDYDECGKVYDVTILNGKKQYDDSELERIRQHTRFILLSGKFSMDAVLTRKITEERLSRYGHVFQISAQEGILFGIDTQYKEPDPDMEIYVVTHRKYNVRSDHLYKPLCVGGYECDGYSNELEGDNIAYLNKKINECTALYWIWKNTKSQYVGLNHYRRYFYNGVIRSMDSYLDMATAAEIFMEYDMILPLAWSFGETSVFRQLCNAMDAGLCINACSVIRNKIEKYQPDYADAFDHVMEGHNMYACNMFITRREILNRYCEWLFSFLIKAAEEIDVEGYDSYSQRVVGFFAERMWTVWLRKNKLRIKELPFVQIASG